MKRKPAWIILIVFAGLQTTWSQNDLDPALRSKIIALERVEKIQAVESKDMKTLDSMLDAGFQYVGPDGKLQSKADFMGFVQGADWLEYRLDALDVRVHQNTVIVTGLYQIKGVKRLKGLLQKGRFVDTWLLKDGTWLQIASLSTLAP
jgi:Domain of unknown function (DUF4440)